jgi:hypothetical protein
MTIKIFPVIINRYMSNFKTCDSSAMDRPSPVFHKRSLKAYAIRNKAGVNQ